MQLIATQIENGLQVLDEKENFLIQLREKFSGLAIVDANDKEGFKAVRDGRLELKNARVAVEKDGKALRENAVKFQKAVIKREDELIAIIAPVERKLQAMEEKYQQWQEEIRVAKEREEKARIQVRVDALAKYNYGIDLYDLTIMTEDKYNELLTQVRHDWEQEQERIAKAKAEEEAAQLAEKQRQEELRLIHEENMRKEREEIERERAYNTRLGAFLSIGFKEDGEELINTHIGKCVTKAWLKNVDRLVMGEHFDSYKELMRKHDLELAEKSRIERERIELEKKSLAEEQRKVAEAQAELQRQKDLREAEERARREEAERIEREAKAKEEAELLAAQERMRQEALRPDKEKLLAFAEQLSTLPLPEVQSEEAKTVIKNVAENLAGLCDYLANKSKNL